MKPKVYSRPGPRTAKITKLPAGGLVRGANACSSSRMPMNSAGIPTSTTVTPIMRPRRRRNSMNLVAIMPTVGTGEPRRSRARSASPTWTGLPAAGTPSAGMVIIPDPPACV
jgi:hypothetical protein